MNQFLKLAQEVLKESSFPLTYQDVWTKGEELGLTSHIKSNGKTPWQTMGARLYVDVRDTTDSIFIKVGKRPARFYLKSKSSDLTDDFISNIDIVEVVDKKKDKTKYSERDLHPLVSYFLYSNANFNRGRAILSKTIFHEKSQKKGLNEWIHPDMVGVYIPIEDWNNEIIELNNLTNSNGIKLYSFELKKKIDRSNYREYFFQAVSNSSWANEGYLVAAEIKEDDELLNELERLSASFGIGVIQLDLDDIDSSKVLFQAKYQNNMDWETMNKLSDINTDFKKFLQDVKIDYESKRIHKSEYDSILDEPEDYINDKIKNIR